MLLLSCVHSYSVVMTMQILGHRLLQQCNTITQIKYIFILKGGERECYLREAEGGGWAAGLCCRGPCCSTRSSSGSERSESPDNKEKSNYIYTF